MPEDMARNESTLPKSSDSVVSVSSAEISAWEGDDRILKDQTAQVRRIIRIVFLGCGGSREAVLTALGLSQG